MLFALALACGRDAAGNLERDEKNVKLVKIFISYSFNSSNERRASESTADVDVRGGPLNIYEAINYYIVEERNMLCLDDNKSIKQ